MVGLVATSARTPSSVRIGSIDTYGLDGAMTTRSALAMASSTSGVVMRAPSYSSSAMRGTARLPTSQSWKSSHSPSSVRRRVARGESDIGRMRCRTPSDDAMDAVIVVSRLAAASSFGPHEMRAEISIAELEPGWPAESGDRLERPEGLAAKAPAALAIRETGERVHHRVDVGRDEETEVLEVVAGVDDDGQLLGAERRRESVDQASAADAARERDDPPARHA